MEDLKKSMVVMDGWGILFTGAGITGIDPSKGASFKAKENLGEIDLVDLYSGDGVGARIVDLIVDDALRADFIVKGDTGRYLKQEFERLKFIKNLSKLCKYSRAYGGAAMIIGVADGSQAMSDPIKPNSIKKIGWLRVYDRFRLTPMTIDDQLTSPHYQLPITYQITPISGNAFTCHYSRMIIMDGVDCHDILRQFNNGWGQSVFQRIFEDLANLGMSFNALSQILNTYIQDVVHVTGLHALIAAGGEETVKKRMHYIDLGKQTINTVLLDALETFERNIASIGGVPEALDKVMLHISAISGVPASKLWGRSPAGLNSTGEGDLANWENDVSSYQKTEVSPILEQFIALVYLQESGKKKEPDDWEIKFNPLRQKTETEQSQVYKAISEADDINVRNGILDPETVAEKRYGGDEFYAGNLSGINPDKENDSVEKEGI